MDNLYTIKGTIGNRERYIQLGDAGRPVLQTKTGYRADRVILFPNKGQAYDFLLRFIDDRKRSDISWDVVEYYPSRVCNTLVGMIRSNEDRYSSPGELWVDLNGDTRKIKYKVRYTKLAGRTVSFYARSNRVKEDKEFINN